jgi:uncharacterized phosphosugar-binding protein
MYRQGDILLVSKKASGKVIGNGRRVIAYGEVTGHSHVMDGNVRYHDNGNGLLVAEVIDNASLIHDEHGKIDIPAGEYLIVRQREMSIVDGVRKVVD